MGKETLEEIALLAAELMTHPDPRVRKVADSALPQKVEQPDDTPPSETFPHKAEERFRGAWSYDDKAETYFLLQPSMDKAVDDAKAYAPSKALYGYYELGADAPVWVGEKE